MKWLEVVWYNAGAMGILASDLVKGFVYGMLWMLTLGRVPSYTERMRFHSMEVDTRAGVAERGGIDRDMEALVDDILRVAGRGWHE